MFRIFLPTLALTVLYPAVVSAQDADQQGRGVARVSLISGDVSVRRGDTNEWVAAAINAPLLSEDRVLTGANSRTEVQFDTSNFARLASGAELRLADIENRRYLVRLATGTMTWRVLRDRDAEVEISTPSIAVRPTKRGVYRISVLGDGSTEVTVRSGEAEIFTPQGSERLRSGRTLVARGESGAPEFRTGNEIPMDDFDRWSQSRDRDLERSESYRYVSRDIYGAEDLDGHGRWVNTPEYGQVWVPTTSSGWAPYRNGRWSWVDYYGWSWVSYDPWGWAPYHYGRWFHQVGIGWCWWPGRINARHFWSPALVGFFGWGGGGGFRAGFGVGFGNWGWVPLAPFETFHPWYGNRFYGGFRNGGFGNNVNITNINVTNIYRNARFDDGITVINGRDFGRGSVNNIRYNRGDLDNASLVRGQLPATPDRESLRWSDRGTSGEPRGGSQRGDDRFYSRQQPSRIDRIPFENQRAAIEETSRRSLNGESFRGTVTGAETRRGDVGSGGGNIMERGGARADDRGGWRRVGETAQSGGGMPATRSEMNQGGDTGGWRRFGDASSRSDTTRTRGDENSGSIRGGDSGASRSTDNGGWRRFGDSGTSSRGEMNRTDRADTPSTRGNDGWGQFGTSRQRGDQSTIPDRGSRGGDAGTGRMEQTIPDRGTRGGDFGSRRMEQTIPDRGSRGGDFGSRRMEQTIPDRGSRGGDFGSRRMEQTVPDRGSRGGDYGGRVGGPVVRERSSDGYGTRGGSSGGGGYSGSGGGNYGAGSSGRGGGGYSGGGSYGAGGSGRSGGGYSGGGGGNYGGGGGERGGGGAGRAGGGGGKNQ